MIPGPLGIADTNPMHDAPASAASRASWGELMQQILIFIKFSSQG